MPFGTIKEKIMPRAMLPSHWLSCQHYQTIMKPLPATGLALLLVACTNSGRFASEPFNTAGRYEAPHVISAPVGDPSAMPGEGFAPDAVISEPLPPPAGYENVPESGGVALSSPVDIELGYDPDAAIGRPSPNQSASLPASRSSVPSSAAPSRTSMTGSWRASEAAGNSCRIVLSSSPSLDLYKATSSGCSSQDLKSVNAWDLRGSEVYLYARGTVVARLKGSGNSFSGVLAKSGAPITLAR